jgi:hypothetical protein
MHMSGESLLIILVIGLIAGWLAGQALLARNDANLASLPPGWAEEYPAVPA